MRILVVDSGGLGALLAAMLMQEGCEVVRRNEYPIMPRPKDIAYDYCESFDWPKRQRDHPTLKQGLRNPRIRKRGR